MNFAPTMRVEAAVWWAFVAGLSFWGRDLLVVGFNF
jgi:hypothetical protein